MMRLLLALFFFGLLFSVSLIFNTNRILSSHSIGGTIVRNSPTPRLSKIRADMSTETYVNNYDCWTKYYNDDRFGRSWDFNITQKYDVSRLREYKTIDVKQKDAGRPGEMGRNLC